VQWADRVPVNHASIVLDDLRLVEANRGNLPPTAQAGTLPGQAVRLVDLGSRLDNPVVRTVTALRHTRVLDGTADPAAVLEKAEAYLDRGGDFAYLALVALGPLAFRRSYPPKLGDGHRQRIVEFLLDQLSKALHKVTDSGAWSLSCSEFVFRCFTEAGLDIPVFNPLVNDVTTGGALWEQLELHNGKARPGDKYEVLGGGAVPDRITPGDLHRGAELVAMAALHKKRDPAAVEPTEADEL
jgi:hypothetical protein